MLPTHERAAIAREFAFRFVRIGGEEKLRYDELEHRIAEELQTFIGFFFRMFVEMRFMRESLRVERFILNRNAEQRGELSNHNLAEGVFSELRTACPRLESTPLMNFPAVSSPNS